MEGTSTREHQQQPWSYSCSFPASFAWPPRSYTCSFCKREFRSAQALGGHMNVHRRDRARLRHCSPPPPPPPPPPPLPPPLAAANPNPRSAAAAAAHRAIPNLNYPPPPPPPSPLPLYYPKRSLRMQAANERVSPEVSLELGRVGVAQCCKEEADNGGLDLELRLGSSMCSDGCMH